MMLMSANSGRSGGVTFVHVLPLSCETCTQPSSDPAQSTPAFAGDSANAKIVAYHSGPYASRVIGPQNSPASGCEYVGVRSSVFGSCRVRSGLMISQLWPSFVVRCTYCEVTYSVFGSCGDTITGYVHQ